MTNDIELEQYRYLLNQISKMTNVLMLHDSGERTIRETERNSLIKIRASEFLKLNKILEQQPETHEIYKDKYAVKDT